MWWWVLIWVLLVVIALAYLARRAWAVWGQFKELAAELEHATGTLDALQAQADRLGAAPATTDLAVFGDPRRIRKDREATRGELRRERQARREARMPGWARSRG